MNTEFKGTPGPWKVDPRYPADIVTHDGDDICIALYDMHNGVELEISGIKWGNETRCHNAALIAAAPELLNRLQELIKQVKGLQIAGNWNLESAIEHSEAIVNKAINP